MKKPQYQKLIEHYSKLVDTEVGVEYRRFIGCGEPDDCYYKGELLEVKPQGLCIAAGNDDGEVFIPFSQIRAYERHEEKLNKADFEYDCLPYRTFNAHLSKCIRLGTLDLPF